IGAFEVQPGPLTSFYVYPDYATVAAKVPFDLYVVALDAYGHIVSDYTGEVGFWATDPQATTPELYRFRPEDRGIASFPGGVTLRTPGQQVVYVFDTSTFRLIGYGTYEVLGAGPSSGSGYLPPLLDPFAVEALSPRPR